MRSAGVCWLPSRARWVWRRTYFDDKVNLGNSVLRIIHYPPMPPEPTPSVRAGAHEDINVITLLLGAEEPGLEVLSRKGEWLPINPPAGIAGVQCRATCCSG